MEGDPAEGGSFVDALADLKRQGCALLVRGPPRSGALLCDHLLGADRAGRRRLVLDTGDGRRHADREADESFVRVDVPRGDLRGGTVASAAGAGAPDEAVPAVDVDRLTDRVDEAVSTLGGDGLAPGELRVCGGDLAQLEAIGRPDAAGRFLRHLTARVRDVGGLVHVHMPAGASADASLSPLFDVLVEHRDGSDDEGPQQRWQLRAAGIETDWLPLERD